MVTLKGFSGMRNQAVIVPSLSQDGTIRLGNKTNLLTCLCSASNTSKDLCELTGDTCIFDGVVIAHMPWPGCSRTFEEYNQKIFIYYIKSVLQRVQTSSLIFS